MKTSGEKHDIYMGDLDWELTTPMGTHEQVRKAKKIVKNVGSKHTREGPEC